MSEPIWLHTDRWLPVNAPLVNSPGERSATAYLAMVAQFQVETAERYRPSSRRIGDKEVWQTWCNRLVCDVTRAMQCEIPWWYDKVTGAAETVGRGLEMTANRMCMWLRLNREGWRSQTRSHAEEAAKRGQPTVAAYLNPRGHGHVAMYMGQGLVCAAGRRNIFMGSLLSSFGQVPLVFHSHD